MIKNIDLLLKKLENRQYSDYIKVILFFFLKELEKNFLSNILTHSINSKSRPTGIQAGCLTRLKNIPNLLSSKIRTSPIPNQ